MLKYEAHRFHDGYLQITIKDKGFLGQGIFLGEAFFPLNELRLGDMDQKLHDLQQIQLPLSKPSGFGRYPFFTYLFPLICATDWGHTSTTWTKFYPISTTYPPRVDNCGHLKFRTVGRSTNLGVPVLFGGIICILGMTTLILPTICSRDQEWTFYWLTNLFFST